MAEESLVINKTANQSVVAAGCTLSYNIQLTNPGTTTISGIVVSEELPAGTTVLSFTVTPATAGFTLTGTSVCPASTAGPCTCGSVHCSASVNMCDAEACRGSSNTTQQAGSVGAFGGSLAAGETVNFCLIVRVNPEFRGTTLNNTAEARAPSISPVRSTASVTVVASAELELIVRGPKKARLCDPVTYQISVTNRGPSTLSNVEVTDLLPQGFTFVASQHCTGPLFTVAVVGLSSVAFMFGTFPACSTAVFTVTLAVSLTLRVSDVSSVPFDSVPPPVCPLELRQITNTVQVGVQSSGQPVFTSLSRKSRQSATTCLVASTTDSKSKKTKKRRH